MMRYVGEGKISSHIRISAPGLCKSTNDNSHSFFVFKFYTKILEHRCMYICIYEYMNIYVYMYICIYVYMYYVYMYICIWARNINHPTRKLIQND